MRARQPFLIAMGVAIIVVVAGGRGSGQSRTSGHERMLALLRDLEALTAESHFYLSDADARRLRAELGSLGPDTDPVFRLELHYQLGEAELRTGTDQNQAIEHLTAAYELIPAAQDDLAVDWQNQIIYRLGVAHLRAGETANCVHGEAPDRCILPISEGAQHMHPEGSRRAIEKFLEVLERTPPSSSLHFAARWLVNLAYMTVGDYPENVPPQYLISPTALASDDYFPRFPNVSRELGLDRFSLSGSVVADDFDGDHRVDLLVSGYHPSEQLRLYLKRGEAFVEVTEAAGLGGLTGGLNMVQADYDNDGDVDVLVLRGAWLEATGRHPNSLLRNNGDGTFTDVTFESGIGALHFPIQAAGWADYDLDGALDLYLGNETTGQLRAPAQLFHNRGDGTFTDVAEAAGVINLRFSKAVSWGDFDGDRFPDLFVSNLRGENRLYRNNLGSGEATFTDVAAANGVSEPIASFPSWFWDFDNDGHLDLFVSAYAADVTHIAASYMRVPLQIEMAALYRGDGAGGFVDVARDAGLVRPTAPMGANFGDLDNDGFLDFYLGTGYPDYEELMPNVMYRSDGGQRFLDVTSIGGFGHLQKGHGVAFVDFDGDGDQDVFEQMGGALAGDSFEDVVYENPGFGNHWLGIRLVGTSSNRSGVGARIRVDVQEGATVRSVYRDVNSGGSFGANPLEQMMGLGRADALRSVEIYWPASDRRQRLTDVPMDRRVVVVESGRWFLVE